MTKNILQNIPMKGDLIIICLHVGGEEGLSKCKCMQTGGGGHVSICINSFKMEYINYLQLLPDFSLVSSQYLSYLKHLL